MRPWSERHFNKLYPNRMGQEFSLTYELWWAILTNISKLGQFPNFQKIAILFQNDVRLQHRIHDSIKTPSCVFPTSSHMPHHHACHVITSFVIPLYYIKFSMPSCLLVIPLLLLNSFNINDNYI